MRFFLLLALLQLFRLSGLCQNIFTQHATNNFVAFCFAETKDSSTWFALGDGYGTGTVGYSGITFSKIFTVDDGLPSASYEQIFVASDGTVWAGGYSNTKPNTAVIAKYSKNQWSISFLTQSKDNPIVKKFAEPFPGQVWIATYGGLYYQKDTSWGLFTTSDGLPDNKVNDIIADKSSRIRVGTESGICLFDKGDFISFEDASVVSSISILREDSRGYVWAGGKFNNDGVSVFDGIRWRTFTMEDGLAENTVGAITEDFFGRMWFGGYYDSKSGGVTMLNNGKFSSYYYPEIAKYSVDCLFGDKLGGVWCGGGLREKSKFGLSYFRKGKWIKIGTREGLSSDRVLNVYVDVNSRVWVSTFYGLFYANLFETVTYVDKNH